MPPSGRIAVSAMLGFALVSIASLQPPSAGAAESLKISFSQALTMLFVKNPVQERERSRIDQSESRLLRAEGARDWTVFVDTGVANTVIPDNRDGFLLDRNRTDFVSRTVLGAHKQFANGIRVRPSFSYYANLEDDSDILTELPSLPNLEVVVPILRGAGVEAASAGEMSASKSLSATRLSVDHELGKTVHRAVVAYWQCLAAREVLESLRGMEKSAEEFLVAVSNLAAAGELSSSTLQRAEADLALRRLGSEAAIDSLFSNQQRLAFALGLRNESERKLPLAIGNLPSIKRGTPQPRFDVDRLVTHAFENRSDLKALAEANESRRIDLKAAENQLLPQLDLTVAVDRVQVIYSMSLGNRIAKGRVSEHRTSIRRSQMDGAILRSTIRKDVQMAVHRLRSSVGAYARASDSTELFTSVVEATKREVTSGESRISALINAEDRLAVSTAKLIEAKLRYALALADLRLAIGDITQTTAGPVGALAEKFKVPPSI